MDAVAGVREFGEAVIPAALEHEMQLIREAIVMVASGRAPRVTVAGLRFAEQLLAPARRSAVGAAVRIVPLWGPDDGALDLVVEPQDRA